MEAQIVTEDSKLKKHEFLLGATYDLCYLNGTYDEVPDANVVQIFITGPSLTTKRPGWLDQTMLDIIKFNGQNRRLFVHNSYAINLARKIPEKHFLSTLMQLEVANEIGAEGFVVHLGSSVSMKIEDAEKNFIENIEGLIKATRDNGWTTKILLETSAGEGTELCSDIRDFDDIRKRIDGFSDYCSTCLDTAHVWAVGYSIDTAETAREFMKTYRKTLDIPYLIHFNGNKTAREKRIDRHADIGGNSNKIPMDGLMEIARYANEMGIPLCLETPCNEIKRNDQYEIIKREISS